MTVIVYTRFQEKFKKIGSKSTEKSPKIMRSWLIIFNLTASIVRDKWGCSTVTYSLGGGGLNNALRSVVKVTLKSVIKKNRPNKRYC